MIYYENELKSILDEIYPNMDHYCGYKYTAYAVSVLKCDFDANMKPKMMNVYQATAKYFSKLTGRQISEIAIERCIRHYASVLGSKNKAYFKKAFYEVSVTNTVFLYHILNILEKRLKDSEEKIINDDIEENSSNNKYYFQLTTGEYITDRELLNVAKVMGLKSDQINLLDFAKYMAGILKIVNINDLTARELLVNNQYDKAIQLTIDKLNVTENTAKVLVDAERNKL